MVFVYATLLLILNLFCWASTLLMAPGNWIMVLLAAFYTYFLPQQYEPRLSWAVVGIALLMAIFGEIIEFAAGAAGTATKGGSKKGAFFALLGAFIGSIAGAIIGIPIPVIGSVIAAIGGGAVGGFLGAYIGESERLHAERFEIGKGALIGRLLGTAGKMTIGLIMFVIISIDSFL